MAIPHLLRDRSSEDGTVASPAVHNDVAVQVRDSLLQIAFEDAFAQMHRLGGVGFSPLMVLADIQQQGLGIIDQSLARLLDGEFLYIGPRFIHQLQKARRVFHNQAAGDSPT